MTDCLSDEILVAVGRALVATEPPALAHLMRCDRCRADVVERATLSAVLADEVPLRAGRAEQIMQALAGEGLGSEPVPDRRRVRTTPRWIGSAAVMAILVQASASLQPVPAPSVVATAALSAIGATMLALASRAFSQRQSNA